MHSQKLRLGVDTGGTLGVIKDANTLVVRATRCVVLPGVVFCGSVIVYGASS
jgi:hypothetical protein